MHSQSFNHSEDGFTIPEMLVVIIVGSLLVSFTLSQFLFSNKIFIKWSRQSESQFMVAGVLDVISRDLLESNGIVELSDTKLVLSKPIGSNVVYHFDGVQLWRNDDIIVPPKEKVELMIRLKPILQSPNGHRIILLNVTVIAISKDLRFEDGID